MPVPPARNSRKLSIGFVYFLIFLIINIVSIISKAVLIFHL